MYIHLNKLIVFVCQNLIAPRQDDEKICETYETDFPSPFFSI